MKFKPEDFMKLALNADRKLVAKIAQARFDEWYKGLKKERRLLQAAVIDIDLRLKKLYKELKDESVQ